MNLAHVRDIFHLHPPFPHHYSIHPALFGNVNKPPCPLASKCKIREKEKWVTLEYLFPLLHCCRIAVDEPHPLTDPTPVDSILKQPSLFPTPTPSPPPPVLDL